jgi:hypothetical protein
VLILPDPTMATEALRDEPSGMSLFLLFETQPD